MLFILLSAIILLGIYGILFLFCSPLITVTDTIQYFQPLIGIITSTGALCSAAIVISTYYEAHKPQLLIQVVNDDQKRKYTILDHITRIHYENLTLYQFNKLNIQLSIEYKNDKIELDNLFPEDMIMLGRDDRNKRFITTNELQNLGLSLAQINFSPDPLYLLVSFDFNYLGIKYKIKAQKYIWDKINIQWNII